MEEYVRHPFPPTMLSTVDGNPVSLGELTQAGAALLVFAGAKPTPEWLEIVAELPAWKRRLPAVRVAAVVEDEAEVAEALRGSVFLDPHGRTRSALASCHAAMAVVLGTDGLLAGGPVCGVDEIRVFIEGIESHLEKALSVPRVLVTSATMGSRWPNSIALPQYQRGRRLDVDFVCFNDASHATRERAMHPRLAGKIPKMLAWEVHPGYDYYLWIDSRFTLTRPDAVAWFLDQLADHDAAFFRHRDRTSITEELDYVLSEMRAGNEYLLDRYRGEDMERQVAFYMSDPAFRDELLVEAGAFIYSSRIVKDAKSNVMKEWFHQNCRWSVQDQLSLPYVLHQFETDVVILASPSIYECEYLH